MLNRFKNSLLLRIALALAIIISLSLLGMFSSVFIAETTQGYAAAINQAGTLRMQSYRIASSLAHPMETDTPYSAESTRQLADEFEQIGRENWRGRGTIVGWDGLHGRLQIRLEQPQ